MATFSETSAATLYESLKHRRDPFLRRAEKAAAVTIPMLVPKERFSKDGHQDFDTPKQGIGARGVNHLAARLLLTLLPPNSPFFRLDMDKEARDILKEDPAAAAEVDTTFRDIEEAVKREIETQAMRVSAAEIFKHLEVAGNVCQFYPEKGGMSFFPLSQYVCERDAEGDAIVVLVIREVLTEAALPPDVRELVDQKGVTKKWSSEGEDGSRPQMILEVTKDVEVFTHVCLEKEDSYRVRQELADGTVLPGTTGSYSSEDLPYRPLRWTKVHGEPYGRGMVEEMLGDLISLESLAKAMTEGALAASRVIGLVRPNGQTHPTDINKARNGEFVRGVADDITFMQLQKHADFRTVGEVSLRVERRVEQSFLLNSSVIRDAERVTAEEVRFAAQELESTLGGVFSILAQEFQLPLVNQIMGRLKRTKQIPEFTKELKRHVKPVVVTGAAALGRSADLEKVRAAFTVLQGVVGPEQVAKFANIGPLIKYVFTQAGVRIDGLTKSPEQIAAEEQQMQQMAMMQSAVDKGVAPVVNQAGANVRETGTPTGGPPTM